MKIILITKVGEDSRLILFADPTPCHLTIGDEIIGLDDLASFFIFSFFLVCFVSLDWMLEENRGFLGAKV